jgi:hypothetical protein
MSKSTDGLAKWFDEKWVDLGRKKKGGGYESCGRKKASTNRKGYPKCVPASKAARMTEAQKKSAVRRKRAKAQGVGGRPTNVKTMTKRGNKRNA